MDVLSFFALLRNFLGNSSYHQWYYELPLLGDIIPKRGEKMQDIDRTSPAIGPADPGSRQSGQLTEGIRRLFSSIKAPLCLR